MAEGNKGVPERAHLAPQIGGHREYKLDEVYALIEQACELGLDGNLDGNMTIGELDRMLNGPTN